MDKVSYRTLMLLLKFLKYFVTALLGYLSNDLL